MTIIMRSVFEEGGKLSTSFFRQHFVWIMKMLQYEKVNISEVIDTNKTSASKECMLCHCWYFKDVGFEFELHVCNKCHVLLMTAKIKKAFKKHCNIERKKCCI